MRDLAKTLLLFDLMFTEHCLCGINLQLASIVRMSWACKPIAGSFLAVVDFVSFYVALIAGKTVQVAYSGNKRSGL